MLSRSWVRWLEKCFSGHQCYQSQVKKAGTYTALRKFLHFSFDWPTGKREFVFFKFFRTLNLKWKLALTTDRNIYQNVYPIPRKKKSPSPKKSGEKIPRFQKSQIPWINIPMFQKSPIPWIDIPRNTKIYEINNNDIIYIINIFFNSVTCWYGETTWSNPNLCFT